MESPSCRGDLLRSLSGTPMRRVGDWRVAVARPGPEEGKERARCVLRDGAQAVVAFFSSWVSGSRETVAPFPERKKLLQTGVLLCGEKSKPRFIWCLLSASSHLSVLAWCLAGGGEPRGAGSLSGIFWYHTSVRKGQPLLR